MLLAAGVRVLTVATDMEVTVAAQAPQLQGQNADVEKVPSRWTKRCSDEADGG